MAKNGKFLEKQGIADVKTTDEFQELTAIGICFNLQAAYSCNKATRALILPASRSFSTFGKSANLPGST
jgi:hypothetical protein